MNAPNQPPPMTRPGTNARPQAAAQQPSRMTLGAITRGRVQAPLRVLCYGVEGVGKSTLGADSPAPVFLGAEDGTAHLDVSRLPQPETWRDVLDAVALLTREQHDFKTLVIDSLDWVEPLIHRFVCDEAKVKSMEDVSYGKLYVAALEQWRLLINALDRLRTAKRMHVVMVAHALVKGFKNPEGPDYERYQLKIHDKAAALLREWVDELLFARFETFSLKGKGEMRAKGISTGARVVQTIRAAAYDAKTRHGLRDDAQEVEARRGLDDLLRLHGDEAAAVVRRARNRHRLHRSAGHAACAPRVGHEPGVQVDHLGARQRGDRLRGAESEGEERRSVHGFSDGQGRDVVPGANPPGSRRCGSRAETPRRRRGSAEGAMRRCAPRANPVEAAPVDTAVEKARVLLEAMPYIRRFQGRTFVIKYGGHAMVAPELKESFAKDVCLLKYIGINIVVVHGGGPQISSMLKQSGIASRFVDGLRVTDDATMEVVEMVLAGSINQDIVSLICRHGGRAVGLSGKDDGFVLADRAPPVVTRDGETVDLGRVGEVRHVTPDVVVELMRAGFIPVIAPIGVDDGGASLNLNADTAAGKVAEALRAEKLILLTDVEGVRGADGTFASSLTQADARQWIADRVIDGGMIPKVECALDAIAGGVRKVHILDGRRAHAVLLEIFTNDGVGTEIVRG